MLSFSIDRIRLHGDHSIPHLMQLSLIPLCMPSLTPYVPPRLPYVHLNASSWSNDRTPHAKIFPYWLWNICTTLIFLFRLRDKLGSALSLAVFVPCCSLPMAYRPWTGIHLASVFPCLGEIFPFLTLTCLLLSY